MTRAMLVVTVSTYALQLPRQHQQTHAEQESLIIFLGTFRGFVFLILFAWPNCMVC